MLVDYGSDSGDDAGQAPPSAPLPSITRPVVAAPNVLVESQTSMHQALIPKTHEKQELAYNLPYSSLVVPIQGPANPFVANGDPNQTHTLKRKNLLTGFAEEAAISTASFNAQQRTWNSLGYAKAPDGSGIVGDQDAAMRMGGKDVVEYRPSKQEIKAIKKRRLASGDPGIVEGEGSYLGPWAGWKDDETRKEVKIPELSDGDGEEEEEEEEEEVLPPPKPIMERSGKGYESYVHEGEERTTFHGAEFHDYMGRTYMHVPRDIPGVRLDKEPGEQTCYIPKKCIHEWKHAHDKPITVLRLFPRSGHLLLSGGADNKIKLWDLYHEGRPLLRTFIGHTKAITDLCFNNSGTHFISSSYDRYIKLWNTETGECIKRFTTGKIPHVIRFNPNPDLNHEFLAGMSDKKIIQFDTNTGEIAQEYDYHLGPVNTITFVDENRRFISTSDDKSLRAWEYGIPVPITLIAEPYMYSMVRSALHPSGKYVAFQSGDNQIVVHSTADKFRQNRKKAFRGHNNAGYAIDLDCSPDGQFLTSGDSGGWVCFWAWKSGRMYDKFKCGEGAVVCLAWLPQETSKVVTGGLEGGIKLWD